MNPVIEVVNIGKSYKKYASEWFRIFSWFGLPLSNIEEHWVLRHISFSIQTGESVGIIGQNGAGKSTLLKLITGTIKPSEGFIKIHGSISAILELGMGFHPDLTGRENAYHSAGLMGFSKSQITEKIEDIKDFAEIGDYFDQPVRIYSSGMQARVAFSVATAFRPDILIVDEVLSVGDTYFQHKSFDRIREFQKQGTTLLIVSHSKESILSVCNRSILLDKGAIIKDGDPEEAMDLYNALIAEKKNTKIAQKKLDCGKIQTISGTGEASITDIGLYNKRGERVEIVGVGEMVELRVQTEVKDDIPSLVLGYGIKDRLGQLIFGTNLWHTKQALKSVKKGDKYLFRVFFPILLGVGSYSIQVALVDKETHLTANYEWRDLALIFNVINIDKNFFIGLLWNEPDIKIEKLWDL
jgi:lipopolysaccharide transport system ATP-binding protein